MQPSSVQTASASPSHATPSFAVQMRTQVHIALLALIFEMLGHQGVGFEFGINQIKMTLIVHMVTDKKKRP
jgi:hypothetical protein